MNQSEQELITGLQQGDRRAFSQVVELYQHMVYNTVLSILQNKADAEDTTQEVFIQVFQSIGTFKGTAKLSTWMYRIAIAKAVDLERKKKRKKRFGFVQHLFGENEAPQNEPVEFNHPGVLLENKEKASKLFKALQKLPYQQKIAFTLNKIEGLNNEEISVIMNTSFYAVESLLARAKSNLKKELKNYYLQDSANKGV